MKCSVTFAYDRYFVNRGGSPIQKANDDAPITSQALSGTVRDSIRDGFA